MRLDKFLKVSRVIKRRTLAKEVCDGGKVMVNGRVAKAGTEIKLQDIIEINFGSKKLKIRVAAVEESVPANLASKLYEIIENIS